MKNHPELPSNAPQWLRDADIEYPKVEIINGLVIWRGGLWYGGEWRGGEWRGGVWFGGMWYGGEWRGGVWHGGLWYGGEWRGGVWYGGEELAARACWQFVEINNLLKIGCKQKTIQEWKEWFENSNETFQHYRSSEQFQLIKEAFYRFYAKTLNT